jgi:hypothetical protein
MSNNIDPKLAALIRLKIKIQNLQLDSDNKERLTNVIEEVSESLKKGKKFEEFWRKIKFVDEILSK